jgi:hypothetical protein
MRKASTCDFNDRFGAAESPVQQGSGGIGHDAEMVARISGTWRDQMKRG